LFPDLIGIIVNKRALPLEFNYFLEVLKELDREIHRLNGARKIRLAKYQTLIAFEGIFGVDSADLLSLKWIDIIGKTEKDSINVEGMRIMYFPKFFTELADRNYKLVDPILAHHLVLSKKENPIEPISLNQFIQNLDEILKQRKVKKDQRSWRSLKKTCVLEAYKRKGRLVSKMFGFRSSREFENYLGINTAEDYNVELKFK
jgi:hypothetical protein